MDVEELSIELQIRNQNRLLCFMMEKKEALQNGDWEITFKCGDEIKINGRIQAKSGGFVIDELKCFDEFQEYREQIQGLFQSEMERIQARQRDDFESGLEAESEQEEEKQVNSFQIKQPYDPDSITVSPAKYSLREIVEMIDGEEGGEPDLDLSPDFQRNYVWDMTQKSRLIESILLNITLPVIYLARNKDGRLQVVDGLQRLTTIHQFFHNEFALSRLEYLGDECDGRYYKVEKAEHSLQPRLYRMLRQYQIDCNVIEPSTPEEVKLDIFKRLNTGGRALNKQEIRHAFMKKESRDLLEKLSQSEEFLETTAGSIKNTRMMDQELILRYIGFYSLEIDSFLLVHYVSKMDDFLDEVSVALNNCKNIPVQKIVDTFNSSMRKARIMFGDFAFRKLYLKEDGSMSNVKNPINKSLFITFSIQSAFVSETAVQKRGNISRQFAEYLVGDSDFMYSISHNTNYQLKGIAMEKVARFMEEIYGDKYA